MGENLIKTKTNKRSSTPVLKTQRKTLLKNLILYAMSHAKKSFLLIAKTMISNYAINCAKASIV